VDALVAAEAVREGVPEAIDRAADDLVEAVQTDHPVEAEAAAVAEDVGHHVTAANQINPEFKV